MRRHFRELSDEEVKGMLSACVQAAIEYAKSVNMSGLSEGESHHIYRALENAILGEAAGNEFVLR